MGRKNRKPRGDMGGAENSGLNRVQKRELKDCLDKVLDRKSCCDPLIQYQYILAVVCANESIHTNSCHSFISHEIWSDKTAAMQK